MIGKVIAIATATLLFAINTEAQSSLDELSGDMKEDMAVYLDSMDYGPESLRELFARKDVKSYNSYWRMAEKVLVQARLRQEKNTPEMEAEAQLWLSNYQHSLRKLLSSQLDQIELSRHGFMAGRLQDVLTYLHTARAKGEVDADLELVNELIGESDEEGLGEIGQLIEEIRAEGDETKHPEQIIGIKNRNLPEKAQALKQKLSTLMKGLDDSKHGGLSRTLSHTTSIIDNLFDAPSSYHGSSKKSH